MAVSVSVVHPWGCFVVVQLTLPLPSITREGLPHIESLENDQH